MKKHRVKVLYFGAALLLFAGTFVSCSNDDDDLKNRVTVLEGVYGDLKAQLGNAITTGASITNVAQDQTTGVYTLTLSDGKTITLGGNTQGGSAISVTVTDTEAIIVVDGTEYKLPLGASVSSFVYSPQYTDGMEVIGNDGVTVNFLARPELKDLNGATFSIAESHVLKTRALDGEEFKVSGEVKLEDGFVKVPIVALNVQAGQTYAISLQMNYKGTVIGSNFFRIRISDDFSFKSEDLVNPTFGAAIKDAAKLADGSYVATLPDGSGDVPNFLSEFNFKDFVTVPGDNTVYEVAPKGVQNANVQANYDVLKNSLNKDGKWKIAARPGTNCSGDANKPGLLVYLKQNEVIKAKVYWKIIDPLADADFVSGLKGWGAPHMEYGEPASTGLGQGEGAGIIVKPGANKINIAEILMKGKLSLCHGNALQMIEAFQQYSSSKGDENLVYSDGSKLVVGDYAKKYATHSKGIRWFNMQTSVVSSNRRNWNMSQEEKEKFAGGKCNGEMIDGWDGITPKDMANLGISITEDGNLVTTSAYGGWGLRVGMGVEFQYDYGSKPISDGVLTFLWFNRRVCAENVKDVEAR